MSFAPQAREIVTVKLPAKAATNLCLIKGPASLAVVFGLADGSRALIERAQ